MVVSAVVSIASVASTYMSGRSQKKAQERQIAAQQAQNKKAEERAKASDEQASQDYNKANQKQVDTAGIMGRSSNEGGGSTLLTGQGGVDPDKLKLGGNTLLGG